MVAARYEILLLFFQAEDGIRDYKVTGVQTCALPIWIEASYVKCPEPRKIMVPTILGTVEENIANGNLSFTKDGNTYSLVPIVENDSYFLIFADETNGEETYGAGRFLYTALPDSNGKVILDFNKAYNPPCAFTKYATCPLPPKDNYLHLKVTAGEKKFGHGH